MIKSGHILGFDYGTHFIGVALGSSFVKQARGLATIERKNKRYDWSQIEQLISKWQPIALVIGMPLTVDGTEQPMSKLCIKFANQLRGRFDLPVYETDERLTTKEAEAIIREQARAVSKKNIDQMAAAVILQAFFDNRELNDSKCKSTDC